MHNFLVLVFKAELTQKDIIVHKPDFYQLTRQICKIDK